MTLPHLIIIEFVNLSDEFDVGSDNVEFTIMSKHAVDSNSFVWNKNGAIHVIDSDPNVSEHSEFFGLSTMYRQEVEFFKHFCCHLLL